MFKWLGKRSVAASGGSLPEINSQTDLEILFEQGPFLLFKHSTACPVSWAAHAQVTRFGQSNPEIPLYVLPVLKERAVSNAIAARTGVRHESPQVILVCSGQAAESASHGAITQDRLTSMLAQCR